jgi:hypothetical protein
MNEDTSINPSAVPDQSSTDVVSLLKKVQQQLLLLEKKIDLLVHQSQERSRGEKTPPNMAFRKRPFSKPFRSFDHPQRHGKGAHGHGSGERDPAQGPYYERRQREKNRVPHHGKKPFAFKRKDRE